MKITPLEIRQHTFEKTFRGYEIEEVDSFLASLSQEWDRVLNESKMLRMQLEIAEKEANKLREIEMTLFKTLKTAEDTSTMITNQANQQAEKQIGEAQGQSENIIAEAQLKAKSIIKEAEEKASYVKEEVMGEVHDLQKEFKNLEKNKNQLVIQLKSLTSDTMDQVNRFEQKFNAEIIDNKVVEAEKILVDEQAIIIEEPVAIVEEPIAIVEEILETPVLAENTIEEIANPAITEPVAESSYAAPVIAGLAGLAALAMSETTSAAPVVEAIAPVIETPVVEVVAPVVEVVAPVIETPIVEVVAPVIETPIVEVVAPVIEAPVVEVVAPVIETPVIEVVAPVIEAPVAEVVAPVIEAPVAVAPVLEVVAPVIEAPVVEERDSSANFIGYLMNDTKETIVEAVAEVKPEPVVALNASEQITDEMLERVNKVKLAIKKAMLEKPDITTAKAEEKGGSFFDEI